MAVLLGFAIFTLASLLSHEIGVLTLPMTWLVAYAVGANRREWRALSGVGVVVDVTYFWLRHLAGGHFSAGVPAIAGFGFAFWKYVSWIVLPLRMSIERSTDVPSNHFSLAAAAAFIAILIMCMVIWRTRRSVPEIAAGLVWLGIAIAPFCGIVPIYQGMAERYTYVAALGLMLAIAGLLFALRSWAKPVALVVVVFWIIWGAWRLNARVLDWGDESTIYTKSLEATPDSSMLLYNLGVTYAEKGDLAKAEDYYRRAIRLNPRYAGAIINLGNVYQSQGNYAQAEGAYQQAISLDSKDPDAWVNLGNVYLQQGASEEARHAYEQAIALRPDDFEAITNLGAALQRAGDFIGAQRAYEKAISIDPSQASAYCDLGSLFLQRGNPSAAGDALREAIKHNPSYAPAYYNLGVMYEQRGRGDLAVEAYQKALEIQPGYERARSSLLRMKKN